VVQSIEDRIGADFRQAVFGVAQCPLQGCQRPGGGAVRFQIGLPLKFVQDAGLLRLTIPGLPSATVTRDQRFKPFFIEALHQIGHRVVAFTAYALRCLGSGHATGDAQQEPGADHGFGGGAFRPADTFQVALFFIGQRTEQVVRMSAHAQDTLKLYTAPILSLIFVYMRGN
jgi:hypothetical protein